MGRKHLVVIGLFMMVATTLGYTAADPSLGNYGPSISTVEQQKGGSVDDKVFDLFLGYGPIGIMLLAFVGYAWKMNREMREDTLAKEKRYEDTAEKQWNVVNEMKSILENNTSKFHTISGMITSQNEQIEKLSESLGQLKDHQKSVITEHIRIESMLQETLKKLEKEEDTHQTLLDEQKKSANEHYKVLELLGAIKENTNDSLKRFSEVKDILILHADQTTKQDSQKTKEYEKLVFVTNENSRTTQDIKSIVDRIYDASRSNGGKRSWF